MAKADFIPLSWYEEHDTSTMQQNAKAFYEHVKKRRTVREFDSREVPPK